MEIQTRDNFIIHDIERLVDVGEDKIKAIRYDGTEEIVQRTDIELILTQPKDPRSVKGIGRKMRDRSLTIWYNDDETIEWKGKNLYPSEMNMMGFMLQKEASKMFSGKNPLYGGDMGEDGGVD